MVGNRVYGINLQQGATNDGACPPRAAVSGEVIPISIAGEMFLGVFLLCVLCIPHVSPEQSVYVLFNFYWNFYWLDASSAFFYFRVSVNVKKVQM